MAEEDRPFNRRNFFREGFKHLLRPIQNAAGPLEDVIKQLSALDLDDSLAEGQKKKPPTAAHSAPNTPPTGPTPFSLMVAVPIRPPGALAEQRFRETCSRCGECVKICPVQCIKIDPAGVKGAGAPYIDIDTSPCVMCDGLLCMSSCPTGALVPTPIGEIDMGTALFHESTCLRSARQSCTICVDTCPIGEVAIALENGNVKVIEDGCTGCGVCQNRCPTIPKSITVTPRPAGGPFTISRGRSRY
jgi:ferredoxin-type protein NapG